MWLTDMLARLVRTSVEWLVRWLPVKVIRDEQGRPFLERYHVLALTNDGPGVCIHHFVASDPDRGYHDHPWHTAASVILAGGYEERVHAGDGFQTIMRSAGRVHVLRGRDYFHRVLLSPGADCWTLFFFGRRRKTWGMMDFQGQYHAMSRQVQDGDGGWWRTADAGASVREHTRPTGSVIVCVDLIVRSGDCVLLIKRGKEPFAGLWALPGGRVAEGDADLKAAALRELEQETGMRATPDQLRLVDTVGNNTRDPRGFTVTCVYEVHAHATPRARAGGDAVDIAWFDDVAAESLAFDHAALLRRHCPASCGRGQD